jgi:NDP-sugar pyrophosphorylase family protein
MSDPNLMVLAGGISSRMRRSLASRRDLNPKFKSDTQLKSKAMITVDENNRPFLDYLLHNAREVGYIDVLIIISEQDSSMREHYGIMERGNEFHGLRISYAVQKIPGGRAKPLGTADAVLQGLRVRTDWRRKKFTVCNSDNLYSRNALKTLLECDYLNAMIDYDRDTLGFDASRLAQFSITQKDQDGFLTSIIEKPTNEEFNRAKNKSGAIGVSMNIFRLDCDTVLPFVTDVPFHPVRNEKELPMAITRMVRQIPRSMYAYPFAEHVPDVTSVDDVERVKDYLLREFKQLHW